MNIALVGNQNCGKTTIFNLLTGKNQKVGNWPGVTIEKKIGLVKELGIEVVDLPGIYSLNSYTSEEKISRDYILNEKIDLIVNVIDATSLERSLYLTTELMELNKNMIIVINKIDKLRQKKISIDIEKLLNELNQEIIVISAVKKDGIIKLKEVLLTKKNNKKNIINQNNQKAIFKADIENEIFKLKIALKKNRFEVLKILENDNVYKKYQTEEVIRIRNVLEKKYNLNIQEIIVNSRYSFIDSILNKVLDIKKDNINKISISDKLDNIFLNKYLAFPVFILIMIFVYYLSVGVIGKNTVEYISNLIQDFRINTRSFLIDLGVSKWCISLITDGIISGIGSVLSFIPQLIILFFCISILETTGYISRVTFILDKLFRKFGLSGESIIPFIVGLRLFCSSDNVY